jgi:hypothetical protein
MVMLRLPRFLLSTSCFLVIVSFAVHAQEAKKENEDRLSSSTLSGLNCAPLGRRLPRAGWSGWRCIRATSLRDSGALGIERRLTDVHGEVGEGILA